MSFPCDLSSLNPRRERLVHVYCETRGLRFYLASAQSWHEAERLAMQYKTPCRAVYMTDKNDSTIINGAWNELTAFEEGRADRRGN